MTVVVRLPNWLGDTVMAVPALGALRRGHPTARLAAVGPWAGLLDGQGLADLLITYPRRWGERLAMAGALRRLRADLAVLLPGSFEAAASAWLWAVPRRVGFATGGRRRLLTEWLPRPEPRLHQVDEYLAVARRAGGLPEEAVPRLAPPPAGGPERSSARGLLAGAGAQGRRPLVGVHLGAAFGPAKVWPADLVADFCRLVHRGGGSAVLLGTAADREAAAAVVGHQPVASLVGRDSPGLLPALLSELDALVAGDTGVAHLAAALGTPVVALFGPTDWRLTAPRGPAEVVRHPVPCSPCLLRQCPIEHPCLRGIEPAEVARRVWARAVTPVG